MDASHLGLAFGIILAFWMCVAFIAGGIVYALVF